MFQKLWQQGVGRVQLMYSTFWGTPFLEKGPPKITEEGPFDPHWPISKINPDYVPSQINAKFQPVGS